MTESKTEICVSFFEEIPIHTAGPTFKKRVILCSVGLSCPLLALGLGNQTQPSSIDLSQCPPPLFFIFYLLRFYVDESGLKLPI